MSAPDPEGVWTEEYDDGRWSIHANVWREGNRRHRIARLQAIRRNLIRGWWRCEWCNAEVPLYRRADARFCRERCRKAARRDRAARTKWGDHQGKR